MVFPWDKSYNVVEIDPRAERQRTDAQPTRTEFAVAHGVGRQGRTRGGQVMARGYWWRRARGWRRRGSSFPRWMQHRRRAQLRRRRRGDEWGRRGRGSWLRIPQGLRCRLMFYRLHALIVWCVLLFVCLYSFFALLNLHRQVIAIIINFQKKNNIKWNHWPIKLFFGCSFNNGTTIKVYIFNWMVICIYIFSFFVFLKKFQNKITNWTIWWCHNRILWSFK